MKENENIATAHPHLSSLYHELTAPLSSPDPHLRTTAKLIYILLFLRIPCIYLMVPIGAFIPPLRGFGSGIFLTGTAAMVAYLIWHEMDYLREFHIDRPVVMLFLLGKPFELLFIALGWRTPAVATWPLYALYILAPMWLLWKLHGRWRELPKPPVGALPWTLVGVGLGILFGFAGRYIIWVQSEGGLALFPRSLSPGVLILTVLYQAAFAGLSEEPVFRGFLWGYLDKLNWPAHKIIVFQASLFALAHLDALFLRWWLTPLFALGMGLVFGWLVWRSRSIMTTITAHSLINGIGMAMQ